VHRNVYRISRTGGTCRKPRFPGSSGTAGTSGIAGYLPTTKQPDLYRAAAGLYRAAAGLYRAAAGTDGGLVLRWCGPVSTELPVPVRFAAMLLPSRTNSNSGTTMWCPRLQLPRNRTSPSPSPNPSPTPSSSSSPSPCTRVRLPGQKVNASICSRHLNVTSSTKGAGDIFLLLIITFIVYSFCVVKNSSFLT